MAPAIPASIRNKNPGAMYPGVSSRKFGALQTNVIGGGHLIAQFPDQRLRSRGAVRSSEPALCRAHAQGRDHEMVGRQQRRPSYVAAISKATGLKSTDKLSRAVPRRINRR